MKKQPALTNVIKKKKSGLICYPVISFFIFIMSSCAIGQPFFIEIKKPAEVPLPIDIAKVLIVDNSVVQPKNEGITQTYDDVLLKDAEFDFDLAIDDLTFSLSNALLKADFFNEVAFARKVLREDDDWKAIKPITPEIKVLVLDTLVYDAIISIDRVLFTVDEKIKNTATHSKDTISHFVDMKVDAKIDASIYLYNQEEPLYRYTISDSIKVKKAYSKDLLYVTKHVPESRISTLAKSLGRKLSRAIAPSWEQKERYIYLGDPRLMEAQSFMNNKKWDEAKNIMITEYEKKEKAYLKGKYANNIALCYEMLDDIKNALNWAVTAQKQFTDSNLKSGAEEMSRSKNYVKDLEERLKIIDN